MKCLNSIIILSLTISPYALAEKDIASCKIDSKGRLTGNYNAIQAQAYENSCILQALNDTSQKLFVVPIGNSSGSKSRVILKNEKDSNENAFTSIELKLFDKKDNTLGTRGRQEIATCFISKTQFDYLPEKEKNFRAATSDFYQGCSQKSNRTEAYEFEMKFNSDEKNNYKKWDVIVAQLHAQSDKTRYCIPYEDTTPKEICNQDNGRVATIERTVDAYNKAIAEGGVFEANLQPPVSFRLKDGYFSIVLFSALDDKNGDKTRFSPAKNCSINVNKAVVGKTKKCQETGKTTTVVFRAPLGQDFPANQFIPFKIEVTWPSYKGYNDSSLKVSYKNPKTGANEELVNILGDNINFGTYDDSYPYFKAGVYRQNNNIVPTSVEVKNLKRY